MNELSYEQSEYLQSLIGLLDKRESDPQHPYWFHELPDGSEADEGISYCLDCLKKYFGATFDYSEHIGEYFGGGYPGYGESDGCESCDDCGKLLSYTLTDYGIASELAHYSEYQCFDWNDADSCFILARIAHGIFENHEQERVLLGVLMAGKNFPSEAIEVQP